MAEEQVTSVKVTAKYQRVAPRKMRLVAHNVVGAGLTRAFDVLKFMPNKSAEILYKVYRSAADCAKNVHKMDVDTLYVKEILVNEGPSWKRFMPRAQGRATKIHKRTSHITVILGQEDN